MPMAMQFVTKNTDKPNKPIEMAWKKPVISTLFSASICSTRLLLTRKNTNFKHFYNALVFFVQHFYEGL